MSKKLNKQAMAEFLAYCHITIPEKTDFKKLESQAKEEYRLYNNAIKEVYGLKLLRPKKLQEAIKQIDEAHKNFITTAQQSVKEFDVMYQKTAIEWNRLGPNYKKGDIEYNTKEFRRFCSDFANSYGEWFLETRLRHDPLDDMNSGTITIRDLQNYSSAEWYPNMSDMLDKPYGARLLEIHLFWWNLTMAILLHQGKYHNMPTEKLRELICEQASDV